MNDRPNETGKTQSNVEPQYAASGGAGGGGGRGRQGVGEAFFMSLIRQVARSVGAAIVRAVIGRR
jgi:hypothetical protein